MTLVLPYSIDDRNMPVRPGSALRNPSECYGNFNINGNDTWLRANSSRAYTAEWEHGSPAQMQAVIEAAETAGLGNCSGMLRNLQARFVYAVLNSPEMRRLRRINRLETGAGVSTVVVYKYLLDSGYDVEQLFSTLIEPSANRLQAMVGNLEEMGLRDGKHFVAIVGKDSEIPHYVEPRSQHEIDDNATEHHNAFLDKVLKAKHTALAPGGFFGSFEWREGFCEHPARVYQALRDHKFKDPVVWETKEMDLAAYAEMFPKALDRDYPKFSPADEMAVRMITSFWLDGWAVARAKKMRDGSFRPTDDYFLHEAHRRPEPYKELTHRAGFATDTAGIRRILSDLEFNGNPHQILTREEMLRLKMDELYDEIPEQGSNLLMAQISQK